MITSDKLFELLSFENGLQGVQIVSQVDVEPEMTFIVADLNFGDQTMRISCVWPNNEDWIFTPSDWQGFNPETPEQIEEIEWRVDDTEIPSYIVNGLPRVFGADPSEIKRAMRSQVAYAVREARKEKGWSLRELAAKTGIAYSNLCRFENGRGNISIDLLSTILDVLGLKIEICKD